jgi:hypothetical protein
LATYTTPETIRTADGVETVFGFNWPYLIPDDIVVLVNDVLVPTTLVGISQVLISPAPANGAVVRIYRNTPAQNPQYQFATGIPFLPRYVDGNNNQLLYALQEGLLEFTRTQDAAEQVMQRSVRVPEVEGTLTELPGVALRGGKLLGFDDAGQPAMVTPDSGSSSELGLALLQSTGSSLVNHKQAVPIGWPTVDPFKVRAVKDKLQDVKSLADFEGFVGDGVNDDSDAVDAAAKWQTSTAQIWNPTGAFGSSSAAVRCAGLTIPKGARVKLTKKVLAPLYIEADGHAAVEAPFDVDMFESNGSYKSYFRGIYFIGGKSHIKLINGNINFGLWMFDHCTFIGSADWSLQLLNTSVTYPVTSTQAIFNECRWVRCKRVLKTQCDHTFIVGGWMQPESEWCDADTAQIYNGGLLSMNMMMVIPAGQDTPFPTRTRLIDNYGAVRCHQARFGGEGGGLPIIYHFAEPTRYNVGTAESREMGIALDQCTIYPGPASRADSAVVNFQGHMPMIIRITDCTGPITRPFIINDPANGGIPSIPAYLSALQTAWLGDDMRRELSYHFRGNKTRRVPGTLLWPAELDSYVFTDRGSFVTPTAKINRTTTQALTTGVQAIAQVNVVAHDPHSLYLTASTSILSSPYAKLAMVFGQVELASHSAPVAVAAGQPSPFQDYTCRVYMNGAPTDIYFTKPHVATGIWRGNFSGLVVLPQNGGNAFDLRVTQNSGNTVNITYASLSVHSIGG